MTRDHRVVIDTSVLISFFVRRGSTPWRAVRTAFEYAEVMASGATLGELAEVLRRPKFDRYVSRAVREGFLATLPDFVTLVPIEETVRACRDPKDDKFLEAAINGRADFLISGDRDLLVMRSFGGVAIVSPTGYLRATARIS